MMLKLTSDKLWMQKVFTVRNLLYFLRHLLFGLILFFNKYLVAFFYILGHFSQSLWSDTPWLPGVQKLCKTYNVYIVLSLVRRCTETLHKGYFVKDVTKRQCLTSWDEKGLLLQATVVSALVISFFFFFFLVYLFAPAERPRYIIHIWQGFCWWRKKLTV